MLKMPLYLYGKAKSEYIPPADPAWKVYSKLFAPYIILAILSFAFYIPAMHYDYSYLDDNSLILDNATFNANISNLSKIFSTNYYGALYRPFLFGSFIIDAQFSGIQPQAYHFANIIYFVISVLLVWRLITVLYGQGPIQFGFILLYAFHPLFVPLAAWIPGRNDSLLMMFWIPSFLLYYSYKAYGGKWRLWLHLAFYMCTLFTKESAIVLPVLCFFADYLLIDKPDKKNGFVHNFIGILQRNTLPIIGWIALSVIFLLMRYSALKGIPPSGDIVGPFELLRNIQTIPIIIAKAFIPLKLFVLGSYDWGMTGLGLGIIGIIAGILMNRKVEGSTILFWILWFLLILLPTMAASRKNGDIYFTYAEHRSFLPFIAILVLLIEILFKSISSNNWTLMKVFTFLPVVFVYAAIAWNYLPCYENRLSYWTQGAKVYPEKAEIQHAFGKALYTADKPLLAVQAYKKAIELSPDQDIFYSDLSKVYLYGLNPDYEKAIAVLKVADSLESQDPTVFQNLTVAYEKKKMIPEALKAAEKAVRLSPNGAIFLNNLTLLYFANKDYVNAEIMARRTIKAQDNILSCYTILFDILITQKRYLEAAELVPRLVKMGVKIPAAAMQLLQPYL